MTDLPEIDPKDYPANDSPPLKRAKVAPITTPPETGPKAIPSGENPRSRKVIKGTLVKKGPSFLGRLRENFLGEDTGTVGSYIIWEVLIPAAKDTLSNMVTSGIEMMLFGESARKGRRSRSGSNFTSYSSIYEGREPRREFSSRHRARHDFTHLIAETRGDAEEVLSNLGDLVEKYGEATVWDFLELLGEEPAYTDKKYGWISVRNMSIVRVREGYAFELPKPRLLE